jgi:hypothetical protein
MSVNDIEPSEDRAFVISRASAIEPSGFEVVVQLEGLGAPTVFFQGRLRVIVPVH